MTGRAVGNLKTVTDELWAVRITAARRTARSGDSVVSRTHTEIISDTAITRGSQIAGCEKEVMA